MADVRRRITLARQRFGKLRHVWAARPETSPADVTATMNVWRLLYISLRIGGVVLRRGSQADNQRRKQRHDVHHHGAIAA